MIDRAREMIHERPKIYAKNMFRFETCWSKQCDQPDGCIFLNLPNNIIYCQIESTFCQIIKYKL